MSTRPDLLLPLGGTAREPALSRIWARAKVPLLYTVLILFTLFYLIPIYVMLVTSFKLPDQVSLDEMWTLPRSISLVSYTIALQRLYPNLMNTFALVIPGTIIASFVGSLNGYVLAKWKFRGADYLFTAMLFGMFVPYQSILIPLIRFMQTIGLYNTITGLVIIHVIYGIPITTLIFRNFYASIPDGIIEAARIDGASILGIYRRIALPLSIPGFVVVGIWEFTSIWNEFLFAVSVTQSSKQPIMVALQNLSGSQIVQWNVQMAAALIAALPTLLVYMIMGKYYMRGLMAGALKG
ncbi:MAG: carbohydrate ABC transporter permease [Bacillota bacterium]